MPIQNFQQKKTPILALYEPENPNSGPKDPSEHDRLHAQLMDWFHTEKDKQSLNRLQQQIDCDFYDSLQWSEEEARELIARGQMPAVYNQVAPMCDWVIGTERRTRVDYKVLPREEGDLQAAEVKSELLKHISDVNRVPFVRSKAFADSVKAGVGWVETGISGDPTKELLFVRHEDWRNIWWDSNSTELDLDDARYLWREKWIDLDVACAMFPEQSASLTSLAVGYQQSPYDLEDQYYLGQALTAESQEMYTGINRFMHTTNASAMGKRERVKVMEFWFKRPERCLVCHGPVFNGKVYDPKHPGMRKAAEQDVISVVNHVKMRMFVAFITKERVLKVLPSPYNHNRFPFTPIWCYRRTRDNLPYGMIRRVRDPQESLNKRQSKAIWHLSARQVIADDDAVDDWQELAEEVARPDGIIRKKKNSELQINSGEQHAAAHIEYAAMDAQFIQKSAGVTDENLGRKTNATSGVAIERRQTEGAIVTTEVFDNLRLAVQLSGEIQMSLTEQFYTMPKIIRITGKQQAPEFIKINQPELGEDGEVSFLNDIAKSQADYIVDEQDFAGSLRQAMFESMMNLTQSAGVTPDVALRLLRMAFEYSDFPNKDEIVQELRRMTGEPDPSKRMTDQQQVEMQAQKEAQQQAQAMAQQLQQLQSEEIAAKVELTRAQAQKLIAESNAMGQPQDQGSNEQLVALQQQTATVLAQLHKEKQDLEQQLREVQIQLSNRADEIRVKEMEARGKQEATVEAARIAAEAQREIGMAQADAQRQRDNIEAASTAKIDALNNQLTMITKQFGDLQKTIADTEKRSADEIKRVREESDRRLAELKESAKERKEEKAKEDTAPAQPIHINVQVDAKNPSKTMTIKKDKDGNIVGAAIEGE